MKIIFDEAISLISKLNKLGIFLEIKDDQLKINAPKGKLNSNIIEEIKSKKVEIIKIIKNRLDIKIFSKINCSEKKEFYALSSAQKRLYLIQEMDLVSTAYNMPQMVPIGNASKEEIELVVKKLIDRHEGFRTSFEIVNDKPMQKVYAEVNFKVENYNIIDNSEINTIYTQFIKPFKLNQAPHLRVGLIQTAHNNYLLADMHHIVSDGTSMELLRNDFMMLLKGEQLPPLRLQYKDYSEWQNGDEQKAEKKKQEEFWIKSFSNEIPILNLPFDYTRPAVLTFEGAAVNFAINEANTTKIKEFCKQTNSTISMALLAIYNILLSKLSGQEDIIVGLPITVRRHSNLEAIIGLFVNTLALRNYPKADMCFGEFLIEVKNNSLSAYKNQDYQFEDLVDKISVVRDLGRNPIFDVSFNMLNMGTIENGLDLKDEIIVNKNSVAKFDLTLTAIEAASTINLNLQYCTKLFNLETIVRFVAYFKKLIEELEFEKRILDIEIITDSEKDLILSRFNNTISEYPQNKTVNQLFKDEVNKHPNKTAVYFIDDEISYYQLDKRSDQLAFYLLENGIKREDIIALLIDRSLDLIISILAVIKAGGAYLPIDINLPINRINLIITKSKTTLVLTNIFPYSKKNIKVLSVKNDQIYRKNDSQLPQNHDFNSLIYVMFTSGSTGEPKGVMVEHKNLINFIHSMNKIVGITSDDIFLLLTTISFDISGLEFYSPLLCGGQLVIAKTDEQIEPTLMFELIKNKRVSILQLTPTRLNALVGIDNSWAVLNKLKSLLVGGEEFTDSLFKKVIANFKGRLFNCYGPTETTIWSTVKELKSDTKLNIGKPIDNTYAYIVNDEYKLLPIGVVGELCLSGDGLARGYFNDEELTNVKFVNNPFLKTEKIYKTGDLARWTFDGEIEFLGRKDNQVKIRGFRIELGEIENQLLNIEGIKAAVVIAKDDPFGQKYLVAYIVSESEIKTSDMRDQLTKTLPDYMIPAHFVGLDEIPLTPNGKIDRKGLPEPQIRVKVYIAPRDEIEERLAEVWSEVLGVQKDMISVDSNFFELGGDSIKTIQIVSRLNRYGLKLSVADMFKYQRIEQLSIKVKKVERKIGQGIVIGEIPLTPIQTWLLNTGFTDIHHFNHSIMLYKRDSFDLSIVDRVLKELTTHHDILRVTYNSIDNNYVQYNNGSDRNYYSLESYNLSGRVDYFSLVEEQSAYIQKSMDLKKGPLVKLGHFITDSGDHLLIVIHHLLIDGISWRILLEDFSLAYNSILNLSEVVFPPKTDSFKYWSERIQEYANSSMLISEKTYWEKIASNVFPSIPKDKIISREQKINKNLRCITVSFNELETDQILKEISKVYNTEINDILLSALARSVCDWGNIDKISIELEGHGRELLFEEVDISRTVGWFTSQYPVVLIAYKDISTLIKETKENLRQIPRKGIGYGILKYLSKNDNRLFIEPEICFNYLGEFIGSGISSFNEEDLYKFSNLSGGESISALMESNHTLNISGMTSNGVLSFTFRYNLYEYSEVTIYRLTSLFKKSLLELGEHCKLRDQNELTPSDYGLKNVSIDQYNQLIYTLNKKSFQDIQDIYELSPMQYGMLYHSLVDQHSGAYFLQSEMILDGDLDYKILEQSFNKIIRRYDVLRTVFINDGLDTPLQVVLKNRDIKLNYKDISDLNNSQDQEILINDYKTNEKYEGFDLSTDNLTKVTLFKIGVQKHSLIWSNHHILMDGWCTTIIYKDIINAYISLKNKTVINIEKINPYRNYIHWLHEQDKEEASKFWNNYLESYTAVNIITLMQRNNVGNKKHEIDKQGLILNKEITSKIYGIAKNYLVTINTFFQALWGILLQKYSNSNDVVFGIVVSGRPPELEGVEDMIGLFINTVPIRIKTEKTDTFSELLQKTQNKIVDTKKYEYVSLAEIQTNLAKSNHIDHIVVFENYPIHKEWAKASNNSKLGFSVTKKESFEKTSYNFAIGIVAGEELYFAIQYNKSLYSDKLISHILDHLNDLINQILTSPEKKISELISKKGFDFLTPEPISISRILDKETLCYENTIKREQIIVHNVEMLTIIKKLNIQYNNSTFRLLLSAYYILLNKYMSINDIQINTSFEGYEIALLQNMIGKLINTNLCHINFLKYNLFSELLNDISNRNSSELEQQKFTHVLSNRNDKNRIISNKLSANNTYTMRYIDQKNDFLNNKYNNTSDIEIQDIDLMLNVFISDKIVKIYFDYPSHLFKNEYIKNVANDYLFILEQISVSKNIKIDDIEVKSNLQTIKSSIINDIYNDFAF